MYNESLYKQKISQPGSFSQIQNNIENNFQLNSAEFDVPQPKVNNLDSVSEEIGNSRHVLHKNRNFTDSVVFNQHFSIDSSGALNLRELQPLKMQYHAENIGHTIPEIHKVLTSYQDRLQALSFQPSAAGPPFPGQFLQERRVSKDNFDFSPSDFECGQKEINNREETFQIEQRDGYLCTDYTNRNNPTFSNQYLVNEALLSLNQQCRQENMMAHSSEQFQGNRMISEEIHKSFQKQKVLPTHADTEQSRHIHAACNNRSIQQSMTYTNKNLFQAEHHGDYFDPEKTNIKNSSFSNQYLIIEGPLTLNQQCLQENESYHSTQIYKHNRMISKELPDTFDVQTRLPILPDPGQSVYIQTSLKKQGIHQSRTFTGGNSVVCPRNNPTSYMENNPHQVNKALDFLKNSNLGINSDDQWDKSHTSGEVNVPLCTTDLQNQETVTKATASDDQNRNKVNFFNSYATKSREFLPLTFPVSTHDKNRTDYSKPSSLESNAIHSSSQQNENWVQCNISTNADRYENLTALHINDSNKFQGYNHLTNSSQEESKYPRNHDLQYEYKGRFSKREPFADFQSKNIFSTAKSLFHPQVHCEQRPFTCNMCPRSFKQRSTLENHIRTLTNEKPRECNFCHCSFARRTTLVAHIRTHTNERPYQCNICHKSFKQKTDLMRHIRTHTNERPFQCEICHESLKLKSTLVTHIRTHTNERPYQCNSCPRSFT
ncbi:Zinc finger protein with KRAB and SCAN domains 8 [Araneus ventricosus]|uniref:Zinc finger protein with KRAB and SCAN domains 8 n=1 Tax=Araneus ventricosus TaxID=182803 RepID=A0A4Y2DHF1_ARAVE|nr:Zinc finger protein with KRAB and SCAN domains 8 [Araneus ventricosus]